MVETPEGAAAWAVCHGRVVIPPVAGADPGFFEGGEGGGLD